MLVPRLFVNGFLRRPRVVRVQARSDVSRFRTDILRGKRSVQGVVEMSHGVWTALNSRALAEALTLCALLRA